MPTTIRLAQPDDAPAVRRVLCDAFPGDAEAKLVETLRADGDLWLECVACDNDAAGVVGHIAYSPLHLPDRPDLTGLVALAPIAVSPAHQRRGIGHDLIHASLELLEQRNTQTVFVLGDPGYYAQFGFQPAAPYGFAIPWGVTGPEFAVRHLGDRPVPQIERSQGMLRYASAFDDL